MAAARRRRPRRHQHLLGKASALPVFADQPVTGTAGQRGGLKKIAEEHKPGSASPALLADRPANAFHQTPALIGPDAWLGTSEARTLTASQSQAANPNGGRRLLGLTPFGGGGTPPTPTAPAPVASTPVPPSPSCGGSGSGTAPTPAGTPPAPKGTLIAAQLTGCPASDYSAAVNVGGQSFMAIADTGSTTFAVVGSTCTDCESVTPTYKPGKTSTDDKKKVEADYGKGKWLGEVTNDQVSFGGGPTVNMAFGAIYDQTDWIGGNNCDLTQQNPGPSINQAIMGLAGTDLLIDGTDSWVAKTNSSFAYPAITFGLCDQNGGMYIGGYPQNNAATTLTWTPMATVAQSPYIAVSMEALSVNGTDIGATLTDFGYTIMDTGTTAMFFPPDVYTAITQQISTQSGGAVTQDFFDTGSCIQLSSTSIGDIDSQLPPLTFAFKDAGQPTLVNTLTVVATNSYLIAQSDGSGGTIVCPDMASSGSQPQTLLGNTIMRSFLTIFDYKTQEVGFSVSKGICKTS